MTTTDQIVGMTLAKDDFLTFLDFVKIREVTPGKEDEDTGAEILFKKWPHLIEIAELLCARNEDGSILNRLLVWLKARQIGASWVLAVYAVWLMLNRPESQVLVLSRGEKEAWRFVEKCKFVWDKLPEGLRNPGRWSRGEAIMENGSHLIALPSTPDAGRGETATLIIMDEADFHPYCKENFNSIKPAVSAGAQMVMVSTSNYETLAGTFKMTFRGAPDNNWKRIFYSWRVRPDRPENFREMEMRESDDAAMVEKEHPNSIEEALAAPQRQMAFDMKVYEEMVAETREPIHTFGYVSVWVHHQVGHRYIMATDSSAGIGKDYCVTVVMDAETGMIVGDIIENTIELGLFSYESVQLAHLFKDPLWAIERNCEWGGAVADRVIEMGYPRHRLWKRHQGERLLGSVDPGPVGWWMDSTNRPRAWDHVMEAWKARQLHIYNARAITQFAEVIKNPMRQQGRIEAVEGGHDDYPTAVAIAWAIRSFAPRTGSQGSTSGVPVILRQGW